MSKAKGLFQLMIPDTQSLRQSSLLYFTNEDCGLEMLAVVV